MKLQKRQELTQERLKEVLNYNLETGVFTCRISRKNAPAGRVAGSLRPISGYHSICLDRKLYYAHRLVWLYIYGRFPNGQIDHINGVKNDNKLSNLRECSISENQKNRGLNVNNTSGYKGVTLDTRTGKWYARGQHKGKRKSLGSFLTAEDAFKAYSEFAKANHGEYVHSDSV